MTLQEVTAWLSSKGIGTENIDLFRAFMPDAPNSCICVTMYGGRSGSDIWKFGQDGVAREFPRIQLKVRGEPEDYETPELKAQDAYRAMSMGGPSVILGIEYYSITPLQPPFPLERDGKQRYIFVCNFELFKQVDTAPITDVVWVEPGL
jgi:hypothetical protein